MIAAAIFLLMFITLLAMRSKRRWPSVVCFVVLVVAVSLLLSHHISEPLNLSF
ncbi:MAG: DUF5993 family protein [Phycisphaerales bacterium]|nr:DUF5993 family protein [Phycisphaerales bacterium]